MATRCLIAYAPAGEPIRSIYCHHDGYQTGVGNALARAYPREAQAAALIDGGDLKSLEWEPAAERATATPLGDAGPAAEHAAIGALLRRAEECYAAYVYVHDGEAWRFFRADHLARFTSAAYDLR